MKKARPVWTGRGTMRFGGALGQLPARAHAAPAREAVTVVVRAMMLPGGAAGGA